MMRARNSISRRPSNAPQGITVRMAWYVLLQLGNEILN